MNIQWYPGHMTKAKRAMKEDIKLIDLVIELVDARVPLGSRNPDIDELAKGKGRMVLLNKADLADERQNEAWMAYFKEKGLHVVKVNARSGMGLKQITPLEQEAVMSEVGCNFMIFRTFDIFSHIFHLVCREDEVLVDG